MIKGFDGTREAVRKTGRSFLIAGSIVGAFLFLTHSHISGWWDWNWRTGYYTNGWRWFLGSGIALVAASYLAYPVMKPIHIGWMAFAHVWGRVSTGLVLCIFFFLVLAPIGWVMQLFGRDLLDEKVKPEAASYWKPRTKPLRPGDMERQF